LSTLLFFENIVVAPNFAAPIRTNSKKTETISLQLLEKKKLMINYIKKHHFLQHF